MKKITTLSATLFAGLILTACGSGGGGGSSSVAVDNSVTGSAILIDRDANDNLIISRETLKNSDLNTLYVNNRTIQLAPDGVVSETWTSVDTQYTELHVCCGKFTSMRFGAGFDGPYDPEGKDYVFYNGSPTTNMPTSGRATYSGYALLSSNADKYYYHDTYMKGTSKFFADFDRKILMGRIDIPDVQMVSVSANIAGNSFTGTAQTSEFRTQADVEGKFYGENAKEMAGAFLDKEKTWGGAFGAAKQESPLTP